MASIFAYPWVLWASVLLPPLGLLWFWAKRRRRWQLTALGGFNGLLRISPWPRRLRAICFTLGLVLLIAGTAGPQWGLDTRPEARVTPTRDLVIVLDLSRSMLAETPSRQELARRGLNDLCEMLKARGGFRVALVVFAAHSQLVFPLTGDYDHLTEAVAQQDAASIPRALRPDPEQGDVSGTRIGAALRLAVQTHDPRMQGAQDIILLSDGDDPLDDREWRQGIVSAEAQSIPIHTVGLGTAESDSPIPWNDDYLRDESGEKVKTRLREEPLKDIARQTGGVYIAAGTKSLPLGRIFQDIVATRLLLPTPLAESVGPSILLQQHYPWFLGAALLLIGMSMAIPERGLRAGR